MKVRGADRMVSTAHLSHSHCVGVFNHDYIEPPPWNAELLATVCERGFSSSEWLKVTLLVCGKD